MRDRSIDEFEALFEQAAIPVLHVERIALRRVGLVLHGDGLDTSAAAMGRYLQKRFGAELMVHYPNAAPHGPIEPSVAPLEATWHDAGFSSTAELVGQVSIDKAQLLILPQSKENTGAFIELDTLVQGTSPPVIVFHEPIDDPASIFTGILHSLTGNFRQTRNFSYSFTLAPNDGRLKLLHTIDDDEVSDVRDSLRLTPDIDHESRDELLDELARHGERYLKGVVAAGRDLPFDVSYSLIVGDTVEMTRKELETGVYSLLVVGAHEEGHSYISAVDYQLMHQVTDIPVLAL